jgi:transposase InsO family protein
MFNDATSGQAWPKRISTDNDPLFQYHRWKANIRVLEIEEVKSLPYVPMSHPFVESLIGSVRRELLDQTFFWTAADLANKLRTYQAYYNEHRYHSGRDGSTPADSKPGNVIDLSNYRWEKYCREQFQLPVAASNGNSPGTGLDAFAHCLEAYCSPGYHPMRILTYD